VRTLLFDLDGTLVDPAVGIVGSFQHALAALGRGAPEAAALGWVIGPPLRESFRTVLGQDADAEAAVRLYRERYSAWGLEQAQVYAGIEAALSVLQPAARLVICTAKPTPFAERVVRHFGLGGRFSAVYGAEFDGRFDDKADLIGHILATERLAARETCMIGDRRHDVVAARAHGGAAIGVLWGYGSEVELTAAGADLLCAAPPDLPDAHAALRAAAAGGDRLSVDRLVNLSGPSPPAES
jgi:phosphoglycolate phosphatase